MSNYKLQKYNTVSQSLELVTARYRLPLSEFKLVYSIISLVQPRDEGLRKFTVSLDVLAEVLSITKKNTLQEIDRITTKLQERVLRIQESEDVLLKANWFSSVKIDRRNRIITFKIDEDLEPYLINIQNRFKAHKLYNLFLFEYDLTGRIYMLIKAYEKDGFFIISIQELKEMMELEGKYKTFKDFNRWVIQRAKKDMLKSDVDFDIEKIKTGRRITHLKFIIITKQNNNKHKILPKPKEEAKSEVSELYKTLTQYGVTPKRANVFVKEHDENYIKEKIALYEETNKIKNIDNPAGFINNAIKGDWKNSKLEKKKKEEEARQKAQKQKQEENKKEKLKDKKRELENEFGEMARQNFWLSRSQEERIELIEQIEKYCTENNYIRFRTPLQKLRNGDTSELNSMSIRVAMRNFIPNYTEDMKIYVNEEIKKQGII